MEIKIYSDIICPFCYIGKKRLDKVLASLGATSKAHFIWKSYLLSPEPHEAIDRKMPYLEYLRIKKQSTTDRIKSATDYIAQAGADEGLTIDYTKMLPASTIDAHRVCKMAHSIDKENEAQNALMTAFFAEGKDIESPDVLIEIGTQVGLNSEDIKSMLQSDLYLKEVWSDFKEAQRLHIQGVPHFIINDTYAIHGAQPPEEFETIIKQILAQENINKPTNPDANACTDEFCIIPDN